MALASLLEEVLSHEIEQAVAEWADTFKLHNVYVYDSATGGEYFTV